jgi:hypothetical protein
MAELDGSIVVVHAERRMQRLLQRILGSVGGRAVVPVDDCAGLAETLRDGAPALIVIGSRLRLAAGCQELVDQALAAGCLGCIVVHEDRSDVPTELFDVGALAHLVTAAMPVLAEELFVTVQKLLRRDVFGLEKYLAWGAVAGETEVTSTDDRLRAIGELGRDVEQMQIGRRQQAAVMLAADELVLNAVHNAPVDETGRRYLRDLGRDQVRTLVGRERPTLRWGCDGRWFAVSVRDAYGSVEPVTIVRYVAKSLARRGQIRSEGAGAGIGLAMTFSAVTQLVFDVDPGQATEAIALVDVRPWPTSAIPPLASFHLFVGPRG